MGKMKDLVTDVTFKRVNSTIAPVTRGGQQQVRKFFRYESTAALVEGEGAVIVISIPVGGTKVQLEDETNELGRLIWEYVINNLPDDFAWGDDRLPL